MVNPAGVERTAKKVFQERMAAPVAKGNQELQDLAATKVHLVSQVTWAKMHRQGPQEHRENRVHRDHLERKATTECPVWRERREHLEKMPTTAAALGVVARAARAFSDKFEGVTRRLEIMHYSWKSTFK